MNEKDEEEMFENLDLLLDMGLLEAEEDLLDMADIQLQGKKENSNE